MKTLAAIALLLALCNAAAAEDGSAAPDLARIFPQQADVRTPGGGLVRLPLSREVLEALKFDLSDLRLVDRNGREVPYLIDLGPPPGVERREERRVEGRVLDLRREELPRDEPQRAVREVYHLALPERPPEGETWRLVIDSDRQHFVRNVQVTGSLSNGTWDVLVPRTSVIRLGQAWADRNEIELPPFDGKQISVTIEGEEDFYLEPRFHYRSARALAAGEAIEVPLTVAGVGSANGRTIVKLRRPSALAPTRLRIATSTPALDRAVTARGGGMMSTRQVGSGRLVRGAGVEQLELDVEPTGSDALALEIVDGDSPPLADLAVTGVMRQPALLFALPPAPPGEPAGTLYFGGHRAWRPRYDLADLLRDTRAAGGPTLEDATAVPLAELGPARPNPSFDQGPALGPMMRAGATIDSRAWRWMSVVRVPASSEGVVQVKLAFSDLPHVRRDLGDVRFIDAEQRQWPYVIAPAGAREGLELRVAGPEVRDGESHWTLTPPVAPLPIERLVITPAQPVLGRRYRILAHDPEGNERVLASGTLTQDLSRPEPMAIAVDTLAPDEKLELVVHDGDDAPIRLEVVTASFALPELLLVAPPGEYTMLAGNPDAEPPRYELERVREMVLGMRGKDNDALVSWATVNPSYDASASPVATARSREQSTQVALWAAILIAVAVLSALTLRVARRDPAARND